jgi:hypothetical protein
MPGHLAYSPERLVMAMAHYYALLLFVFDLALNFQVAMT